MPSMLSYSFCNRLLPILKLGPNSQTSICRKISLPNPLFALRKSYLWLPMLGMYDLWLHGILLKEANTNSGFDQINARLGEVLFMSATSMSDSTEGNTLVEAIRRFCRSVELCDDYLRGYYGLKMVHHFVDQTQQQLTSKQASDRLLARFFDDSNDNPNIQVTDYSEVLPPQKATVQKLNEQATSKLAELTRRISYNVDNAEIVAAKILLDKSTQTRQR